MASIHHVRHVTWAQNISAPLIGLLNRVSTFLIILFFLCARTTRKTASFLLIYVTIVFKIFIC